jgi:hypothetical protein
MVEKFTCDNCNKDFAKEHQNTVQISRPHQRKMAGQQVPAVDGKLITYLDWCKNCVLEKILQPAAANQVPLKWTFEHWTTNSSDGKRKKNTESVDMIQ